ncbi:3-ketoacyl-reductase [Colletotrichum truncatum]|uniref:3-ketoacyl-reductase n=1 Tax=Colletotrichum truncatum TaxID=5467 RepID=A0ACC3YQJ3_COLTU|nr:3-ketoacyl-reductase [Colletotrichum truncatum]KAF6789481.1 3-ketoacyl-reductase [Colletotrichum truncatum]
MKGVTDYIGQLPEPVQLVLASIGALFLANKALGYVKFLLGVFVLSGTNLRTYGKPGTWAVVTGASDGLGKEYAYQLASKGFNLVLVSRTQSKLEALAHEIEAKFSGKILVKVLAMDYTRDDNADYDRLAQTIDGLDVGILINNVGQSHSIPVPFLLTARDELQNIVTVNCLGTLKTTQVVAPIMQKRKSGLILTMGSFAGWIPSPYLATYSGSKAFLQHWSTSLAAELKSDGIDVQLVVSYLITTAMSKIRRTSLLIPNPKSFVRAALGKVGTGIYQDFAYSYTPWWSHALLLWVVENTIGVAHEWAVAFNLKMHADIRTRALKKAARDAKKA